MSIGQAPDRGLRTAAAGLQPKPNGPLPELAGFSDLEAGLVLLTHPMKGYFLRRDGALGTYASWHDRLGVTEGEVVSAEFPLLDRLGLVAEADRSDLHSVLIQRSVEFAIYLPPQRL